MSIRPLLFALLLSPTLALAGEVELPNGLAWCADTADVLLALEAANELSDGVIEAEGKAFGLRGTITALLDADQLVGVRFRCFDTDANLKTLKGGLSKQHGEGTLQDQTREGGDRRLKIEWEVDALQDVSMKVSSEQIYVAWEVQPSHCIEAEKSDIDATTRKKAIAFDPFAEEISDVDARKKAKEDAKKTEEKKEEETKKEEKPEDVDIDW